MPAHVFLHADDLEEALLFDFEAEEAASLMAQTKTTVTSSLVSAAASAGSLAPGGSLPSVLSGVRSITKDSAGTHVLTENFTLHIEEVRDVHTTSERCSHHLSEALQVFLHHSALHAIALQTVAWCPFDVHSVTVVFQSVVCTLFSCRSVPPVQTGRRPSMPSMCCVG
jgi:hypothetical protein